MTPPKVSLLSRFHSFFHSLLEHPSPEIQTLFRLSARDLRTNVGKNLRLIEDETDLNPWLFGSKRIKRELLLANAAQMPETESWRLPLLGKLLDQRTFAYYAGETDMEENLNAQIKSLVST